MDARLQQLLEALQAKKQQQPIQPMQAVGAVPLGGWNAPQGQSPAIPLGGVRPAPVQAIADAVAPQPLSQGMPLPDGGDTNYYPNGIRRQPMDERLPDGTVIGAQSDDAVPLNPFYNAQYDTRNGLNAPPDRQQYQTQIVPPAGGEGLPYAQNEMNRALGELTQIGQASQAGARYRDLSKLGVPTAEDRPVEGHPAQMPVTVTQHPPDTVVPPKPPSEQEWLETELERIRQAPPEKQNKWMEALIIGLQATQRIADPTNQAGSYQQGAPIKSLAEMKKAEAIQKVEGRLKPIYEKNKRAQDQMLGGLKVRETQADIAKKEAEAKALGVPKPTPPTVKVNIGGKEVEVPATAALTAQTSKENAKVQAEATVERARIDREVAQGKYTVEQGNKHKDEIQKWETDVSKLILDGEELQNLAGDKEIQADKLEAQGGVAEAAKLRTEASADRTAGRAKIKQGNELRNNPPKKPETYTVPKGKKVSNANDPRGYFN